MRTVGSDVVKPSACFGPNPSSFKEIGKNEQEPARGKLRLMAGRSNRSPGFQVRFALPREGTKLLASPFRPWACSSCDALKAECAESRVAILHTDEENISVLSDQGGNAPEGRRQRAEALRDHAESSAMLPDLRLQAGHSLKPARNRFGHMLQSASSTMRNRSCPVLDVAAGALAASSAPEPACPALLLSSSASIFCPRFVTLEAETRISSMSRVA